MTSAASELMLLLRWVYRRRCAHTQVPSSWKNGLFLQPFILCTSKIGKFPGSIDSTTILCIAQAQNLRDTLMPPSPSSPMSKWLTKFVDSSFFMNL